MAVEAWPLTATSEKYVTVSAMSILGMIGVGVVMKGGDFAILGAIVGCISTIVSGYYTTKAIQAAAKSP